MTEYWSFKGLNIFIFDDCLILIDLLGDDYITERAAGDDGIERIAGDQRKPVYLIVFQDRDVSIISNDYFGYDVAQIFSIRLLNENFISLFDILQYTELRVPVPSDDAVTRFTRKGRPGHMAGTESERGTRAPLQDNEGIASLRKSHFRNRVGIRPAPGFRVFLASQGFFPRPIQQQLRYLRFGVDVNPFAEKNSSQDNEEYRQFFQKTIFHLLRTRTLTNTASSQAMIPIIIQISAAVPPCGIWPKTDS